MRIVTVVSFKFIKQIVLLKKKKKSPLEGVIKDLFFLGVVHLHLGFDCTELSQNII